VRILAIDVGTGTQDILLFDSSLTVENNPKMVMPSATTIIARRIGQATRSEKDVLLTGVTMGGGPCSWAAEAHLKAGHKVFATPDAARTFDDHLENVERAGIRVVSEDEAKVLARKEDVACIEMKDLYLDAIEQALATWEKSLDGMGPGESIWPSPSRNGLGITSGTFYTNLRGYLKRAGLPPAGVHILRHSAAKLRRDVGESVEEVSRFLDHSSLAVTTVYLRRLEGAEDRGWTKVAEAIGV